MKDAAGGERLGGRRLYEGKVLALDLDEVEEPGGVRAMREVVRHSGSVAVLPVHEDGSITLVRQYRWPARALVWELPAGRRDAGETPEQGARRELVEEVGLEVERLEKIAEFWTTPGFCDEVMHLFRGSGLRAVPPRPEQDERIEARHFTLDEAMGAVARGEIREGKTLVALLLEARRVEGRPPEAS
jgi:ADP-ribose pyrophosphatase